ncbi:hypothetical protein LJR175_008246 [Variovorax sp. LjRoot175]|uniref:hypothetical protein n=1 Tax=Variovorax sp. LjRoot175 TaxID=3342276 RepID=UPI003ECD0C39
MKLQMGRSSGGEQPAGRPTRRFRVVRDFLEVPPAEVGACLRAFQDWIERGQDVRAAARREGVDPLGLELTEFTWLARAEPSAQRPAVPYPAIADIRDLGLRPSAMHKLRELNLYALEDFTQVSEDELLAVPDVGRSTVVQIRSYLHRIGLDFRESNRPGRRALQRAKIARLLPAHERNVSDESSVSELGLKPATVSRCLEKGITTIGSLRNMPLRDIWICFGEKSVLELVETLQSVGLELASRPNQLEKWRYKAIRTEKLQPPAEDAPTAELAPWLGAASESLQRAGIHTVGEVRALAAAGGREIRGMGPHAWQRVFDHFGVRTPSIRKDPSPLPRR